MKPRVYLLRDWTGNHRLVIVEDAGRGKIRVASGFQWTEYDEGSLFDQQEGIAAAGELVQRVMDRAWEEGLRPAGFSDVKNETAAIRDHLKDMRAIAFGKLKLKSPQADSK